MVKLDVVLPKGHLQETVFSILDLAGYKPRIRSERSYLIKCNDPDIQFRIHRAQNIGPLVEEGVYDIGITGLDWIRETEIQVEELLNLNTGRVDIVAAVPQLIYQKASIQKEGNKFEKLIKTLQSEGKEKLIIVSEYVNISKEYYKKVMKKIPCSFITSYGATETFINVADMIIDCTETGTTLRENGWEIIDTLFESTARIIANKNSLRNHSKKEKINDFLSLVKGALDAQRIRLIKMNVPKEELENIISILPSMKSPTISKLYGEENGGYAVEVAVGDDEVLNLIPLLKKKGATDILELDVTKVVK